MDSVLSDYPLCDIQEKRVDGSFTPSIISRNDDAVYGHAELTGYPTFVPSSASCKSRESSITIRSHSERLPWRHIRLPFGSCSQLLGIIPARGLFHEVKTSAILPVPAIPDSMLFTLIPRRTLSRRPSRRHIILNNRCWHHNLVISEISAKEIGSRGKGMPLHNGMDSCHDCPCHTCSIRNSGSNISEK